ncbi:MAG TPA: patatin-like phospholipase family protein [Solirubrobacterales bacterium]
MSDVLALISRRMRPGYSNDDDGAKLALVIEGGGMRGVVAGGMVTALDEYRLQGVFDMVIGSSAGALAGAYFLAEEPRMGTSIYYEDLVGKEWLSYRRALAGSPILAFDYLFDQLITHRKKLDCDRVLSSPVPLYVVATRVPEYRPIPLGNFQEPAQLVSALRASTNIPLIAGRPVSLPSGEYIDGALTEAIPVSLAMKLGATHMLVLLTRPRGKRRRPAGNIQRRVAFPAMNRIQPGLGDVCAERAPRYSQELALLDRIQAGEVSQRAALAIQLPPDAETIGLLEQDPEALHDGAAAGAAAVREALPRADVDPTPDLALEPAIG